jgi:hypothetical protein
LKRKIAAADAETAAAKAVGFQAITFGSVNHYLPSLSLGLIAYSPFCQSLLALFLFKHSHLKFIHSFTTPGGG